MSGRHRTIVVALFLLGILAMVLLVAFAGNACPVETELQPCPDATRNLVIGVALAAGAAGLLVAPFAFLAEFVTRRRIVYRGAWARAARRGLLVALVVATLAGLRLGGALTVPTALFVLILAGVAEWFAIRADS
jgi:MFS family permease